MSKPTDQQQSPPPDSGNGGAPSPSDNAPVSDQQIDATADAAAPEDFLSPDERAAFAEMAQADGVEPPPVEGAAPAAPDANAAAAAAGAAAGAAAAAKGGAAAPAADEDDDGEDEPAAGAQPPGGEKTPKRVNFNKFKRTEERATAAEREAQALKETLARADERMKLIQEALMAPKPGEQQGQQTDDDPKPDPEQDVFAYLQWQDRQITKLNERLAGTDQRINQTSEATAVASAYENDVRSYVSKEPNFGPAYQFLMSSRVAEVALHMTGKDLFEEGGPQLTPQEFKQVQAQVEREERQIVTEALRQQKSPAEKIFKMARARGFRPQAAQQAAPANGAAPAQAAAPAAAAPAGGKPTASAAPPAAAPAANGGGSVSDMIQRLANGQDAALSLSNGGAAPGSVLDAKRLADMPQDQFNQLMEQIGEDPAALQRLFEGSP